MTVAMLLTLGIKSTLVAGLSLTAAACLPRLSSARRAAITGAGLLASVALPVALQISPRIHLPIPEWMSLAAPPAVTSAVSPAANAGAFSTSEMILVAYALPAIALLVISLVGLARLTLLTGRSQPVVDAAWCDALVQAVKNAGISRVPRLRISDELQSPISWGVRRPVIVVDPATAADRTAAASVLAHECAHIARFDWPMLVLARLASAVFWFNPLIWRLARAHAHLIEQAADDHVLRSGVSAPDYVGVLVAMARQNATSGPAMGNPAVRLRSSLSRRVLAALDPAQSREPTGRGFAATLISGGIASALLIATISVTTASADPLRIDSSDPRSRLPQYNPHTWDWAAPSDTSAHPDKDWRVLRIGRALRGFRGWDTWLHPPPTARDN